MGATVTIQGMRIRQLGQLRDRCTVTRGVYPDQTPVETDLPCQVRPSQGRGTQEHDLVQADTVTVPLYGIRVPAAADIARGDVVAVTVSADPTFVGTWFTVVSVNPDTQIATRLVTVQEVQS